MNVVTAAITTGVKKVIALSTDKAVSPINLYGATKLCSDKIFTAARSYAGARDIKFSVVRYGNVFGSRGSVVPFFINQKDSGVLPITDERMTRFWITLQQGVDFVLGCIKRMKGSEIFVPKIPSMKVTDLARAIAPNCRFKSIGIRPGEKVHEILIAEEDARVTMEFDDYFVIGWKNRCDQAGGCPCPPGFKYGTDNNDSWLSRNQLREYIAEFVKENKKVKV
jgi:UDP-N-acetylglucosamine 4,6-dehydratase